MTRRLNAMTVDVEDYFHVSAFASMVSRSSWALMESRVCANTNRLLDLFAQADIRATFFVLGWVAERFPDIVRRIHDAGHELASHSYDHGLVFDKTPEEFRQDLRRARDVIEQAAGVPVRGYRAPSFSITAKSLWALGVLAEEGYAFDSSIYPINHDRYGIPDWSRNVEQLDLGAGRLWELPGSTVRRLGLNLPIGGGGYFRLLPYGWTHWGIGALNQSERRPAIFYIHPWEIDPDQPRIQCGAGTRVRHYRNLEKTEKRLSRLVKDFRFGTVSDVLAEVTDTPARTISVLSAGATRSRSAGGPPTH